MRPMIVFYSYRGNNRLLAGHLARRLGCDVEEVVERRRRSMVTIGLDLLFNRKPEIVPIGRVPRDDGHVLFVSPLWNRTIAHPMKSAIRQLAGSFGSYAFASFHGGERPGQAEQTARELVELAGSAPAKVWSLCVNELVPADKRDDADFVSNYRVSEQEIAAYPVTDDIVDHFLDDHRRGPRAEAA